MVVSWLCAFISHHKEWWILRQEGAEVFFAVSVSTDLWCAWDRTFRKKIPLGTRGCKYDWVSPRRADSRGMWRLQDSEFWISMCCCVCRFCCLFLQSQYFCCVPSDLSWSIPAFYNFVPFFNSVSTRIWSKLCLLAQWVHFIHANSVSQSSLPFT